MCATNICVYVAGWLLHIGASALVVPYIIQYAFTDGITMALTMLEAEKGVLE